VVTMVRWGIQTSSPFPALRHRALRLFWIGSLISGCGVWMQNLALGWLLARMPHSSLLLGLYGFASLAPVLGLSFLGGTLADRADRRRILLATQFVLMFVALGLGALAYWGQINWWQMILAALLTGVALALNSPAYQALLPDLVPREDLAAAVALNSIQFNLARIIGHSLAGFAVAYIGEAGCFLLNALSYIAMIHALLSIRVASQHRRGDEIPFATRAREGLTYLAARPDAIQLILTVACISLLGLPYFFLLPKFGRDVLGADARALGWLTAAVSVGALVGGLLAPSVQRLAGDHNRRGLLVCSGGAFWLCLFGFSMSRNYWLSVGLLTGLGFWLVVTITTVATVLQSTTPTQMRGRVMSVHGIAVNGMAPIGAFLVGAAAEKSSAPIAVAAAAGAGFILCSTVLLVKRRSRCGANSIRSESSLQHLSA